MNTFFKKSFVRFFSLAAALLFLNILTLQNAHAQNAGDTNLKPLRSDVGIHGITANFPWLGDYTYLGDGSFATDGSSELEIVYRNIRMMSQQMGIGYQLLGGFFVDGANSSFGVGSWGLGPVFRYYPFTLDKFQPYVQANTLFGRNFGLHSMANSAEASHGFRVRLGLRAGAAIRLNNTLGLFTEIGYDWEGPRIFKADGRALQVNVGLDVYLFN